MLDTTSLKYKSKHTQNYYDMQLTKKIWKPGNDSIQLMNIKDNNVKI